MTENKSPKSLISKQFVNSTLLMGTTPAGHQSISRLQTKQTDPKKKCTKTNPAETIKLGEVTFPSDVLAA